MTEPASDPPRLTAPEFEALCKLLFGDERTGWQAKAAALLGVNLRNVAYWAAEPPARAKPIPPAVGDELMTEIRRRLADPEERARMVAWLARHALQGRAMAAALGMIRKAPGRLSGEEWTD